MWRFPGRIPIGTFPTKDMLWPVPTLPYVLIRFFQKAEAAAANPQAEKPKAAGDGEENLTPNQYTEIRKKKLDEIRNKGLNPYPHKVTFHYKDFRFDRWLAHF